MQSGGVGHYIITKGKNQQGSLVLKESMMTRAEVDEHRQRTLEENREAFRLETELKKRHGNSPKAGPKTTGLSEGDEEATNTETQLLEKTKQLEELSKLVRDLQQAPYTQLKPPTKRRV